MPTYKLTYFDVKGFAESIRMILSYMGRDFEDNRVAREDWPVMKPSVKFGKLPILEIDGKQYSQSSAICRFLAEEAGIGGSNAAERLEIDIIAGSLKDMAMELSGVYRETNEEVKAQKTKVLKEETIPFYMGIYNDQAKKGYLANDKLSWVDFYFLGYTETLEAFSGAAVFDKYPNLKTVKDNIYAIPNVKKWIDKRPASM